MIVGIDLDGVLFNFPFNGLLKGFKKGNLDFLIYRFLRRVKVLRGFFYSLVRINLDIMRIFEQLAQDGHRIVIISGYFVEDTVEVRKCLVSHKVPFDALRLYSREEGSYPWFKLKEITKQKCDFYIEDRSAMVSFLNIHLGSCQVVYYKGRQSLPELKRILKL